MVAKVVSGKSIRGILHYNETKVNNAEAQLLMACGFPRDPEQLSFKNKLERFEKLTSQNEKTKTNAMHISLNFSVKDVVDDELLKRIALDYMDRIGFGGQPFLVYRHYDAAHPHIHIATVNITDGGERIETHNIGKNQSEKARKELEERFNLVKAEEQNKEMLFLLKPAKLKSAIYGRSETKSAISAIVRDVVSSYKFTSLTELNAVLRQFNVMADRGEPDSKMYANKGLIYCLLDDHGERIGVPIKASSIYSSPTLNSLEKKFISNSTVRKPFGVRLKHLLDKAIQESQSIDALQDALNKLGIRIVTRENVNGNVHGVTFIDNATRSVFKGSDLGKTYSAAAFMHRIQALEKLTMDSLLEDNSHKANTERPNQVVESFPAAERQVFERLIDIALSGSYEENSPDPFRRKKKKRLRVEG